MHFIIDSVGRLINPAVVSSRSTTDIPPEMGQLSSGTFNTFFRRPTDASGPHEGRRDAPRKLFSLPLMKKQIRCCVCTSLQST